MKIYQSQGYSALGRGSKIDSLYNYGLTMVFLDWRQEPGTSPESFQQQIQRPARAPSSSWPQANMRLEARKRPMIYPAGSTKPARHERLVAHLLVAVMILISCGHQQTIHFSSFPTLSSTGLLIAQLLTRKWKLKNFPIFAFTHLFPLVTFSLCQTITVIGYNSLDAIREGVYVSPSPFTFSESFMVNV